MKLFVTILVLALLASSASPFLFGRRKNKALDIHISKGFPVVPVGQVPVGQVPPPFVGLGIPIPAPVSIQSIEQQPFYQQPYLASEQYAQQGFIRGPFQQGPWYRPVPVFPFPPRHFPIRPDHLGTKGGQGIKGAIHQIPAPVGSFVGQSFNAFSVPVLSKNTFHVVPIDIPERLIGHPQLVSVEPSVQAMHVLFKSASSPLSVQQQHLGTQNLPIYHATRSEERPHILRHIVHKPVVQDVREIIQPYRTVTQEIKPVLERVHTIVPRGRVLNNFQEKAGFAREQQLGYQGVQQLEQLIDQEEPIRQYGQQRVHFDGQENQEAREEGFNIPQKHIPIEQEPIVQEEIEQLPIKGHHGQKTIQ